MRLIDADKLIKDILDLRDCYNGFSDTYDKACIIGVIDEQPTVEPERKKGKWIQTIKHHKDDEQEYNYIEEHCSACGVRRKIGWRDANYCPNCGAEMRGEQDE